MGGEEEEEEEEEAPALTTEHDTEESLLRASSRRLTGTCCPAELLNSPSWSHVLIKTRGLDSSGTVTITRVRACIHPSMHASVRVYFVSG